MRWKVVIMGLALTFAVTAGCKQQLFIQECDYNNPNYLPPKAECNPNILPPTTDMKPPTTIFDLSRKERPLALSEAIAIALENGTTGIQSVRLFGTANDDLEALPPAAFLTPNTDSIRVLALDPAVIGQDIEGSLSKFDAYWRTSMNWNASDQPNQGLNTFQNGNFASFLSQVVKPLPTGGDVGVTFQTNYSDLKTVPAGFTVVNPAYQPSLTFNFDQPLLQGFGVDINQLTGRHPEEGTTNLSRSPYALYPNDNGIVIARLRFDQSRADFERAVSFMLANVETAYWNLYGAYVTLYAREQGMRIAYAVWQILKAQLDLGKIDEPAYEPQLGQYEQFRADRLQAVGQVLERERQLRALLGMPPEDGTRLVPIDAPTLTPFQPDWHTAANEALALRPELVLAREDVKLRQLNVLREKNNLLPDLRFMSSYNINALGTRLDGDGSFANGMTDNAFRSLASNHFNNWSLGLALNVPIGYRAAYAQLRVARLRLAEGYLNLRDQEDKAMRFLALQYRQVFEFHQEIQGRRAQREAYGKALAAQFEQIRVGRKTPDVNLQDVERQWTTALDQEFQSVVAYNNALATFEFAKGTLLQHDNVIISEGPLPCCAQVRAVEHERQRSLALVARERAAPDKAGCCTPSPGPIPLPVLPKDQAPALPTIMKEQAAPGEPLTDLSKFNQGGPPPASLEATGLEPSRPNLPPAPAAPLPVTANGSAADPSKVLTYSKSPDTIIPAPAPAADPSKVLTYSKSPDAIIPAPAPAAAPPDPTRVLTFSKSVDSTSAPASAPVRTNIDRAKEPAVLNYSKDPAPPVSGSQGDTAPVHVP
jgi:outer membrane protein TolC